MKTAALILAALLCLSTVALAGEYVNGYTRSNGTYVQGHYRSSPDNSYNNNYSTQGNNNPYTGQSGTQRPTWNDQTPESNTRSYGDPGYNSSYADSYKNYNNGY
jgi:hypothetical protein